MIIVRRIDRAIPSTWVAGVHWYVEYHSDDYESGYPCGIAFVTAAKRVAYLDFIFVVDQDRRTGIGTALLNACRRRWPYIEFGEAISKAGAALLTSLPRAISGK